MFFGLCLKVMDLGGLIMRFRLAGIIASAAMALLLSGCYGENTNTNRNANANAANANANAAVANSNSNTNANANTNRAPTREEYERDKERYQREAKQSGRTIGTGLNDGWLWVKARFDLAAVDDLRDSTINVDIDNAVVTLTGTVANAAQKKKAEDTAKSIEGVKGVKNLLKIAPNPSANANANANKATPRK
jgi:osmotically-inducible protein OsmY